MLDRVETLALVDEYRARSARRSLLDFAHVMSPSEWPAPHHRVMARMLEGLAEGKIARLMLFLPPRAAKSLYAKYFVAWMLGRRRDTKIVHCTHTASLADDVGYDVRRFINSDLYPWSDVKVSTDRAARTDWQTSAGGRYYGTSMSAGPTGRPANILIIDDPITNAQDADSDLIRERQWQEYVRGLRSRLQPWSDGAPPIELMVLTRWSEDDLAGRHLPEGYDGGSGRFQSRVTGEEWVVCSMPARAEHENDLLKRAPGEWLWPERFGDDSPWAMAERIGGRGWSALYQQRPAPESGVMIQREWLSYYDQAPPLESMTIYGASDYAVTAAGQDAKDPDYTVHMIFGVDPAWNVYLLDMWRDRATSDVWVDALLELAQIWRPLIWGEEAGQIISGVGPLIDQRSRERGVFFARRKFHSRQSKGVRAGEMAAHRSTTLIGMLSQGRWKLPRHVGALPERSWWRRAHARFGGVDVVVREMMQFPAGRHDDTVDPQSLFARMLGEIIEGQELEDKPKTPPDSLEALFLENERSTEARL